MATPNQLREFIRAQPFRPFTIRMADDQTFTIRHPENAACSADGLELVILVDGGSHLLEMLMVKELAALQTPSNGS
jgi:hypothetical protein